MQSFNTRIEGAEMINLARHIIIPRPYQGGAKFDRIMKGGLGLGERYTTGLGLQLL
jgi:hypothetical protein